MVRSGDERCPELQRALLRTELGHKVLTGETPLVPRDSCPLVSHPFLRPHVSPLLPSPNRVMIMTVRMTKNKDNGGGHS